MKKEGITALDIELSSSQLDFLGEVSDTENSQILKGVIRLSTSKAIKLKSLTVKFKGETTIFQSKPPDQYQYEIISPILPKLKARIYEKSTTLSQGDHVLPWEIEVPNIYPVSFCNKRSMIKYIVQMKISLGINKTIIIDRTINLKRYLLESQQLAALASTQVIDNTFGNGFQYHIEYPKTIWLEQGYVPISLIVNPVAEFPLENVFTQIKQEEVYRCRHISKVEADVAITDKISLHEQHKSGDSGLIKYIRPLYPIMKYTISQQEYTTVPLLLKHRLESNIAQDIESPLVAISHQLEVIFYFGSQQEEVRVRLPILVSSVPDINTEKNELLLYTMETMLHTLPIAEERSQSGSSHKKADSIRSTIDESIANQVKDSLSITEPLKKSVSDQDLQQKNRPPSTTQFEADKKVPDVPLTSNKPKTNDGNNSFGEFVGLHPPPRRTGKKEINLTLPETDQQSPYHLGSQPSSPISPRTPKYSTPNQPLTPMRRQFLNQSKSTSTVYSNTPISMKRRSNSIDHHIPCSTDSEDYSKSITNHYVRAELPPIPTPEITRQQLPSIPLDKSEHRKTRLYYDDESDEDAYDLLYSEYQ